MILEVGSITKVVDGLVGMAAMVLEGNSRWMQDGAPPVCGSNTWLCPAALCAPVVCSPAISRHSFTPRAKVFLPCLPHPFPSPSTLESPNDLELLQHVSLNFATFGGGSWWQL